MKSITDILSKIPDMLSSKVSIIIYIALFGYLIIFAILCTFIPELKPFMPPANAQLILGNYTNVLSALGASIAAGSGVAVHSKMKKMREKHDLLQRTIDELHSKIDKMMQFPTEIDPKTDV